MSEAYGDLEPVETCSSDELRALQLARLQETVERCFNRVPFYRQRMDRSGVRPEDIRELEDIALLPFTEKTDLRDHYPYGLLAVPREQLARTHASSGTTGRPTVVAYTSGDVDRWAALMARSIRAAGGRPGDTVHVAYGYGLFTGGLGAHYGAERLGCNVVPASGGATERQVTLIRDLSPRVIMVTPSYMLVILDEMERQGLAPKDCSLRVGMFGAEPWSAEMRAEIERRSAMTAVDIYGLSELMGPGVAQECSETQDGLTIWEDHFLPEIVDPVSGAGLPPGTTGELVLTSLTREAMPLLRYRTRDLSALLPPTARSMRRLARIRGRSDDMMIVRGVNLFPSQIEEIALSVSGLSPHFCCVLSRPGRMDELEVRIEPRAKDLDERERADLAATLTQRIKDVAGVTVRVALVPVGTIGRSAGKAQRVIDQRAPS